jgi:hypothetical protein
MPSPFPGMDPYLESPTYWSDFHSRFVNVLSEVIAEKLPRNYAARIDEEVVIVEPEGRGKEVRPDIALARDPLRTSGASSATATAVDLEPVTLSNVVVLDPRTQPYIRIVRLPGHELVTVLELLSPTNKGSEGRSFYLDKRQRLMNSPVSLVELDLLRAGKRFEGFDRPLPPGDYYAFVSRAERRPSTDVYAWKVQRRLPPIPVPLRDRDPDVLLDLGAAFAVAYGRGRYGLMIDYSAPPPPPAFAPDDAQWVAQTAGAGAGAKPA